MSGGEKRTIIAIILIILLCATAVFIYHVTGREQLRTSRFSVSCESARYSMAFYSETTSGVDWEGDYWEETDRWTEKASDHWLISTINGKIGRKICPDNAFTESDNKYFYLTASPKRYVGIKKKHLERVRDIFTTECRVSTLRQSIVVGCNMYKKYLERLEDNGAIYVDMHHKRLTKVSLEEPKE